MLNEKYCKVCQQFHPIDRDALGKVCVYCLNYLKLTKEDLNNSFYFSPAKMVHYRVGYLRRVREEREEPHIRKTEPRTHLRALKSDGIEVKALCGERRFYEPGTRPQGVEKHELVEMGKAVTCPRCLDQYRKLMVYTFGAYMQGNVHDDTKMIHENPKLLEHIKNNPYWIET